jgi:Uncharacterised protein family (UPF0158)
VHLVEEGSKQRIEEQRRRGILAESTFRPDMETLAEAFESNSGEGFLRYFLDRQTGAVLVVTGETLGAVEEAEDPATVEGESDDEVENAILIINDTDGRYIEVEGEGSHEAFQDMEYFTQTVSDPQLRYHLETALRGSRPFRRFKDALAWDDAELQRWYAYSHDELHARIRRWLHLEGLPDS